MTALGAKFISGDADSGQLILTREDGSTATLDGFFIVQNVTLVDNNDSTFDLTFDGS